jgi:hypothetical protein
LSIDCTYFIVIQISPKLFKIQPSPGKPEQSQSKKKAWISLDSLGGIEPFQRVALTPGAKNLGLAPFPRNRPRPSAFHSRASANVTRASDFRKRNGRAKFGDHGREAAFHDPRAIKPIPSKRTTR